MFRYNFALMPISALLLVTGNPPPTSPQKNASSIRFDGTYRAPSSGLGNQQIFSYITFLKDGSLKHVVGSFDPLDAYLYFLNPNSAPDLGTYTINGENISITLKLPGAEVKYQGKIKIKNLEKFPEVYIEFVPNATGEISLIVFSFSAPIRAIVGDGVSC